MARYKLTLEYDGTGFAGWQKQKDAPTVQETVESAFAQFLPTAPALTVAGRTDAGVHATGQVAHMDLETDRHSCFSLLSAVNHFLKQENRITVLNIEHVPDSFHARFSATKRSYVYKILNRRAPLTFQRHLVWHVVQPLDLSAMQQASQHLLGAHDFSSFRDSQCQAAHARRTLDRFEIEQHGEEIWCHVSARSFLHHQVRILTGTLVEVGLGKRHPDDIKPLLEQKDRRCAGVTAPAHGLYLTSVDYPNP